LFDDIEALLAFLPELQDISHKEAHCNEEGDLYPMSVTGDEFRRMSQTKSRRAPDYIEDVDRSDQQRCHKIPNEILAKAYNSTDNVLVKKELMKFNYSSANIFRSANNGDHGKAEVRFKHNQATAKDFNGKGESIKMLCKNWPLEISQKQQLQQLSMQ
jgi:hypothetical protein